MAIEAVLWMNSVQRPHFGISRHLGENRGGGNYCNRCVPAHDPACGGGERRAMQAVHEDELRHDPQSRDCPPHGQQRRLQNIERIDLLDARAGHRPCSGASLDGCRELFAPAGAELLRIRKPCDGVRRIEYDCSCNHRSGKRAPSCLVDTALQRIPCRHVAAPASKGRISCAALVAVS